MGTTPSTTTPTEVIGVTATLPTECGITGGQLQSATEKPYTPSMSELPDAHGNVIKRQKYGSGNIVEHQAVVALDCTTVLSAVQLGVGGVASVSISTSTGGWPMATVVWYTGLPECQSGCTFEASITLKGARLAQPLGLQYTGHCQSSTWTASATLNLLNDKEGEPTAYAFGGGTITASVSGVGGTITAPTGWEITDGPTEGESNTAFPTITASGSAILTGTPTGESADTQA